MHAPRFREAPEASWPLLTHAVTIVVDDVDAHYDRARHEGATLLGSPTDQPWGLRSYAALDPEGHQWEFAAVCSGGGGGRAAPARPAVQAQLSVRGGAAAVTFYRDAFGAEEVFRVECGGEEDPEVVAQLEVGSTRFWVEDESPAHANFSPETLAGATGRMLLVVDGPGAVVARALACGARLVLPVEEEHGWLLGRIVDPAGHHWEIGVPRSDWPPGPPESEM